VKGIKIVFIFATVNHPTSGSANNQNCEVEVVEVAEDSFEMNQLAFPLVSAVFFSLKSTPINI